jgi:hypothetical protein
VMIDMRGSDKSRLLHQLSTQAAAEVGLDAAEVSPPRPIETPSSEPWPTPVGFRPSL